ncbi:MAG TPA: AAA family ATPase [Chthoniobacteraceae bacterium]|jgi:predicted ATPase|nr:AAA family ATPase [Chthoniobacteraceae bacterium]
MITHVSIENFKSLVKFDLPPQGNSLGWFTCLIGMNGAGKSSLLQAFDFIAHVATGNVQEWLRNREWKKSELVSNLGKKNAVITFTVEMKTWLNRRLTWNARFNTGLGKCTFEAIFHEEGTLLRLEDGKLNVENEDGSRTSYEKVPFEFEGSVLSTLKLEGTSGGIIAVKNKLASLCSLELLSPQLMRRKARTAQDIGGSGEKLSPFLNQLPSESKMDLLKRLQEFYPHLIKWNIKGYRAGWKILRMQEDYGDGTAVEAGHINDGFLRVIAILAQAYTTHSILLLDEIENGMNPAIVERLVDFLVELGKKDKQVIVTTHSPLILNYLEDSVAREAVMLLYKNDDGSTKACRYFDQPETHDKLRALGPGEVFADTDLRKMVARLAAVLPDKEPQHTNGK